MAGRGYRSRPAVPTGNGSLDPAAVEGLKGLFQALADPSRLTVLTMLAENGELNVAAIGAQLGHSQPAISHHLKLLKAAGLVRFRREGKFNFYTLHPTGLHELVERLFPDGGPPRLNLGGVEVSFRRNRAD